MAAHPRCLRLLLDRHRRPLGHRATSLGERATALDAAEHELGEVAGEVARLQAACRDALAREAAQRRAADRAELRLEASRREHFKLREDFRRLRMAALARGAETPAPARLAPSEPVRTELATAEASRERLPGYTPPPGSAALASRSPFRDLHNGATPTPWKRTPRRAAPSTGRSRISM